MGWRVRFRAEADAQFVRLDKAVQRRIIKFLETRIATAENPRRVGAALTGDLKTLWKYRVGDYRLVCNIEDATLTVLVIKVGHRRKVYRL